MDLLSVVNNIDKTNDISTIKEEDLHKHVINGKNILHLLASRGNVKSILLILKRFKDYNVYSTDVDGNTLFHHLFYNGFYDMDIITKYTKSLGKTNNDNMSVIRLSVDSPKVLKQLIDLSIKHNKYYLTQKSKDKTSLITDIIDKCDDTKKTKTYRELLFFLFDTHVNINDDENTYILFYCLDKNNILIFDYLLNKLTNANVKNSTGLPLISYAVLTNNETTITILCNRKDININVHGPESRFIPLNLSLIKMNEMIIRTLISKRPDMNVKDRFHNTILHNFLMAWKDNNIPIDIIMYIVSHGDINAKNFRDETPLHIITKKKLTNYFINIIKEKNPDMALSDKDGKNVFSYSDDKTLKTLTAIPYSFKLNNSSKIVKDNNKLDDSNYGLFNSDIIHSMIYTLTFLQKYDNLCIPYQSSNTYKKNFDTWKIKMHKNSLIEHQDTLWTLTDLYNNMFYNILPHVIIWRRVDQHYIDKNFSFLVRLCLRSTARFVLIKLTLIPNEFTTHANMVIFDKKLNKVIRFEPYGVNDIVDGDELDKKIKHLFDDATESDVKYVRPDDYLTDFNWQTISHDSESEEKILGDPVGYCLAWCYWFIDMKLQNPDVDELELMEKTFNAIQDHPTDVGNKYLIYIRSFASKLDKMKNKFMSDISIPHLAKYHTTYTDTNLNLILDNIKTEVKANLQNKQ